MRVGRLLASLACVFAVLLGLSRKELRPPLLPWGMRTRSATAARDIPLAPTAVWQVLADFGSAGAWFSGLKSSESVGDIAQGLGAQRRVYMVPTGSAEEVVTDWQPDSRIAWSVGNVKGLPFKAGTTEVDLTPTDSGTHVEFAVTFDPRGPRPVSDMLGGLLTMMFTRMLPRLLTDLETEAVRRQ